MSDLHEHLERFIHHMKIKNYSPATIASYHRQFGMFCDHLKERGITDIKRVTHDTIMEYVQRITAYRGDKNNGYTIASISQKIRAIKRFFEYMEKSDQLLIDPTEKIKEPRKESRLPKEVLTEEEVARILAQPDLSTLRGIRDRAILEVFYSTGIRLEEMINLTIFDCDLQGGLLRVNKGKFAKDRVIPLGKHAVRFLKEYLARVRPKYTRKDRTVRNLFVTGRGGPLTRNTLCPVVSHSVRKAGTTKRVTPHTFRHTFATHLIKNGADVTTVQRMLGHSRLSVTAIYTKVAGVEVKRAHTTHHPREHDEADAGSVLPAPRGYYRAKPS